MTRVLNLPPSSPLEPPGAAANLPSGSGVLSLSSRMFPEIFPAIPGLQISYLQSFGKDAHSSRLLVEFVRPFRLSRSTTIYGEAHGSVVDFWNNKLWSEEGSSHLAVGGGFRKLLGANAITGAHVFYDADYEREQWRSSASVGAIVAAMLPGNDAFDFTVNWYSAFSSDPLTGLFNDTARGSVDGTITYYHELWNRGPDFRISLLGFITDESQTTAHNEDGVYGARAALATRDGMFRAFYQYERESSFKQAHSLGLHVNVGFRLENLLALESPIEKPAPVFSSPRNLSRWLNVSEGTERHLRKHSLVGHDNCSHSECEDCWDHIKSLYETFSAKYPDRHFESWRIYLRDNMPGSCRGSECEDCIYFVDYEYHCIGCLTCRNICHDTSCQTMCTRMAIKWRTDWDCCATRNPL